MDIGELVEKMGLEDIPQNRLIVEAGIQWLKDNTTIDFSNSGSLPAVVPLFLIKFHELMGQTAGVKSESLGGMSQSFSGNVQGDLWNVANGMLLPYLKSNAVVFPGERKWDYGNYHS